MRQSTEQMYNLAREAILGDVVAHEILADLAEQAGFDFLAGSIRFCARWPQWQVTRVESSTAITRPRAYVIECGDYGGVNNLRQCACLTLLTEEMSVRAIQNYLRLVQHPTFVHGDQEIVDGLLD